MTAAPLFSSSRVALERNLIQTSIKSTKTSPHGLLVFLNIPDYMVFACSWAPLSLSALQSQIHSWHTLFSGPAILHQHLSALSFGKTPPQACDVCHHPTEKRHLSFNINALTSMSFAPKGLWIILVPNPLGTVANVTAHMPFLPGYSISLLFYCKIFDTENVSWRTIKNFSLKTVLQFQP